MLFSDLFKIGMYILSAIYLTAEIFFLILKYERRESNIKEIHQKVQEKYNQLSNTYVRLFVDSILLHVPENSQSFMPKIDYIIHLSGFWCLYRLFSLLRQTPVFHVSSPLLYLWKNVYAYCAQPNLLLKITVL